MSGGSISEALEAHVETICRSEFRRLEHKFRPLSPQDRMTAQSIVTDVIAAVVVEPMRALAEDCPPATLDALVRLFALDLPALGTHMNHS